MYKITYGQDGIRGIEYASRCSTAIVEALWGHKGATANLIESDQSGTCVYHLTDDTAFNITPLTVTCGLSSFPA